MVWKLWGVASALIEYQARENAPWIRGCQWRQLYASAIDSPCSLLHHGADWNVMKWLFRRRTSVWAILQCLWHAGSGLQAAKTKCCHHRDWGMVQGLGRRCAAPTPFQPSKQWPVCHCNVKPADMSAKYLRSGSSTPVRRQVQLWPSGAWIYRHEEAAGHRLAEAPARFHRYWLEIPACDNFTQPLREANVGVNGQYREPLSW